MTRPGVVVCVCVCDCRRVICGQTKEREAWQILSEGGDQGEHGEGGWQGHNSFYVHRSEPAGTID